MIDSQIPGFYRLSLADRLDRLVAAGALDPADAERLQDGECVLSAPAADKMIENVIGVFGLPLAVAPNFLINDRDRLAPLVVEEPSIVAGLSGAAKLARAGGGFNVAVGESLLVGQVQVVELDDADLAMDVLDAHRSELLRLANVMQPNLLARGGGTRDIRIYKYRMQDGRWTVVLHLLIDTCDAMGANLVNTICEGIAPRVESLTGGRAALKILSNLADRSLATARVRLPLRLLGEKNFSAEFVRDGIVQATEFADRDPHRAVTHNKGIMNGIDAVAIATGNDWRAIEAGAHAYAARLGSYRSLSHWHVADNGDLAGELTLPLKVGVVGGTLQSNPAVVMAQKIAGAGSAADLAGLMAAVGLAQNFAALRALVTHGIQQGHMSLHARSVAAAAGAPPELFEHVVSGLVASGEVKSWKASELIAELGTAASAPALHGDGGAVGTACGKVILLGEHAAVYDKHVLAVPLPDAVRARAVETDDGETFIVIPDWGVRQRLAKAEPEPGAAAAVALIQRQLGLAGRSFTVSVEAGIPAAMGLGASAALSVAVIRAFDSLLGLGLDNRATDRLAFECEKLAHGTPSGIDNNIATYCEPVLYTRTTATRTKPLQLSEPPPLIIASSGRRGITRDIVAAVRARRARNTTMYDTVFAEIDELSVAGAVALRDRRYDRLGAMMNVCQGFLNAIEVSTPELEKMIHIARTHGAVGAKLTGAGGGGSIVALCPGRCGEVASALERYGYGIIRMGNDSGE